MIHKNIILCSSNENKISEFKSFGLDFEVRESEDLKEVQSDPITVATYKAIEAGEGKLIEDTVLLINDEEIVDIKWKINELKSMKNPDIKWVTTLAILDKGFIYIYQGSIECDLVPNIENIKIPSDSFGFDSCLVPSPNGISIPLSFHELKKIGKKDDYSPRKFAVECLLNNVFYEKININEVPEWTGSYQND